MQEEYPQRSRTKPPLNTPLLLVAAALLLPWQLGCPFDVVTLETLNVPEGSTGLVYYGLDGHDTFIEATSGDETIATVRSAGATTATIEGINQGETTVIIAGQFEPGNWQQKKR